MLIAAEAEAFENKEFGVSAGAMLPAPEPEEQPPSQPVGLKIEPPPWQDKLDAGDLDLDALGPPERQPDALAALDKLKLDTGDVDEIPPWGPPVVTNPAPPIRIPEADWHLEQQESTPAAPAAEPPAPRPVFPRPPWDTGEQS
jgi:hypothetical protein